MPTLGYHPTWGTWAQAWSVEMLCFPRNMEGAGTGVAAQDPRGWDLSPPLRTPGPGQHVDVSAELSRVLGHLFWCGIVPRVHWLQWGPLGTQWWLQQQSHTCGQEQQGEAAAGSSHLRGKEQRERQNKTHPPPAS